MPTPFQHLVYARALLEDPALSGELRTLFTMHPGPFLLGCTAVDVQAVTGQPRPETHFYDFPPPENPRAEEIFLMRYPELAEPCRLEPAHAAFLSGYLNHLVWDEVWAWEVYIPKYLFSGAFPNHQELSRHHNGLRVYLDHQAEAELHRWPPLLAWLGAAEPQAWLPFVDDAALRRWRDWLVDQLAGRVPVESAKVFAGRTGVSPEALEAIAGAMAEGRYIAPVPGLERALERYTTRGGVESRELVMRYWKDGRCG